VFAAHKALRVERLLSLALLINMWVGFKGKLERIMKLKPLFK
jgi:hypothetical protein